jgi:hypothetical protein
LFAFAKFVAMNSGGAMSRLFTNKETALSGLSKASGATALANSVCFVLDP